MRLALTIGSLLITVLTIACSHDETGGSIDGATIFSKMCVSCHGETGKPPEAMVARLGVHDLTAPDVRARLTPEHVDDQVHRGSQNKLMPGFAGLLTDDQIKAVARYVASPAFLQRKP